MDTSRLSLAQRFAALPRARREEWLAQQDPEVLEEIVRGEWWWLARPDQVPPPGDWLIYLILAGRGFGKSRSGSEWLVDRTQLYPLDRSGAATEHLVIAETLSDARTICMEGPAGILRVLDRRKIEHRYYKSPKPMVLFPSGSKIYCEGADDEDVGRGYNLASLWGDEICVAHGEPVVTSRGTVPVEQVSVGDKVMTRKGWHRVVKCGLTRSNAEVITIITDTGSVRVTPEHRVWTIENGWTEAQMVHVGCTMLSWNNGAIQSPPKPPHTWNGTAKSGTTTSGLATTTTDPACSCTEPCGSGLMAPSRTATKYTTLTESDTTTDSPTSSCSKCESIDVSLSTSEIPQHERGASNAVASPQACGQTGNPATSPAASVEMSSGVSACEPNTAQSRAVTKHPGYLVSSNVVAVVRDSQPVDVYDLTVEGEPEFFAGSGSLLIHNCKWPNAYGSWYEGILPGLRADLPGDHPRAFITTTPKPTRLLKEWLDDSISEDPQRRNSILIVRGSTFDNAANLSSQMMAALENRYKGTDLGRQELHGEMLDESKGALFRAADLDAARVDKLPEDPISIIVGVDPAQVDDSGEPIDGRRSNRRSEGNHDEMGVVVVARTRDDSLYVLADESIQAAGRPAALHVWRTVLKWNATHVIYESNVGKQWMKQVFEDAYKELVAAGEMPENTTPPMEGVDAKLGKKTRAEPVALRSQQQRIHMVGKFPLLEDQLTTFSSWDGKESPDRLDAFVHACRKHMLNERRKSRVVGVRDLAKKDDGIGDSWDFRMWGQ